MMTQGTILATGSLLYFSFRLLDPTSIHRLLSLRLLKGNYSRKESSWQEREGVKSVIEGLQEGVGYMARVQAKNR